ncbi:MAG TPA: MauE/DoxX family redox-associated membrane protein [Ohtaekwangia sp.]|nr:MauE/DoxX family redox-associated membrane protein [Ohtaekwangia sp.]
MSPKTVIEIISTVFVLLFVYAALSKLLDYEKFVVQVGQSPMLTDLAPVIAWFIPGLELVIALLLIIPKTRLIAMYASFGLMTAFTTYILLASQFTDYVPCSCGGVIANLSWTGHLIFNIALMALAMGAVLYAARSRQQLKREDGSNTV